MRHPHLKHPQIVRLGRLLDMMYKPAELAAEIDVTDDTIRRSYLPAGLPCTRDTKGNIWIHGLTFAAWARQMVALRKSKRAGLPDGHAWCMKCNRSVLITDPKVIYANRGLEILQSSCPDCRTLVNRAQSRKTGEAQRRQA
jgi:hypothetical protein